MVYWGPKSDIMTTEATYGSPYRQPTPFPAAGRFLIDTAPVRIAPNPFAPNKIQFPNRRKTSHFDKSPGFSPFTIHQSPLTNHRTSNRNCLELEIAVTPSPSSKSYFLIATAKGGNIGADSCSRRRRPFPKMGQIIGMKRFSLGQTRQIQYKCLLTPFLAIC